MSIEIIGQQKYDIQDMVCVELFLNFKAKDCFQIRIEPRGEEDAQLQWVENSQENYIEVQVKAGEEKVTLKTIAKFLTHFPPHQSKDCLLERLINDPARIILFIVSGRCDDITAKLIAPNDWSGSITQEKVFQNADAILFLTELKNIKFKETSLEKKRKQHISNFAKSLLPKNIINITNRVIIIDQMKKEFVSDKCNKILRHDYRIPNDRLEALVLLLLKEIKQAKETQADAAPALREVIKRHSPSPLRPIDYLPWEDESVWYQKLSNENALLLSGISRCGKTYAARSVAASFQRHGYTILERGGIDEAERFLFDPSDDDRVFVLDDPLGGNRTDYDAVKTLDQLRKLLTHTSPKRKLIVAQNQSPLFVTMKERELASCKILNFDWVDLSNPSPELLVTIWEKIANEGSVPKYVKTLLSNALLKGTEKLEIGCLQHLSVLVDKLPQEPNLNDIVRLARTNARDLERSLTTSNKPMQELLLLLAVCSTQNEAISLNEIAFCTTEKDITLPTKTKNRRFRNEELRFTYPENYILQDKLAEQLDDLERLRFVDEIDEEEFIFSHSFYRAAAEEVFTNPSTGIRKTAVRFIERGLFCVSPRTTQATAKNLDWLYEIFSNHPKVQDKIVELAIDAIENSCFPATRDICFIFLTQKLVKLPSEIQEKLPGLVSSITTTDIHDVNWHNGHAFIPSSLGIDVFDATFLDRMYPKINTQEVEYKLDKIKNGVPDYISAQDAVQILMYLKSSPEKITNHIAHHLLSYDDAMIRAETARIWLSLVRTDDTEVLKRIADDLHPQVTLLTAKGFIHSWDKSSKDRREAILEIIKNTASKPAMAMALLPWLEVFERPHITKEKPPWPIFSTLMPTVLKALPFNCICNEARFYNVMEKSVSKLAPEVTLDICEKWINWLERILQHYLPSEFLLAVISYLIKGVTRQPQIRLQLISRLLSFPNTGALLVFVKDLIDHWSNLTPDEQDMVIAILTDPRIDQRWLHATAITRHKVPSVIQELILGSGNRLVGAHSVYINTDEQLLNDALSVYCGDPELLYYLSLQSSQNNLWESILHFVLIRPNHPSFKIVFDRFLLNADDDLISDAIKKHDPKLLETVFNEMLSFFVRTNATLLPKSWSTLFSLAPDENIRNSWYDQWADAAPAIIYNLSELFKSFSDEKDIKEMIERLKIDYTMTTYTLEYCNCLKSLDQRNPDDTITKMLCAFFHEAPPKLLDTYERIITELKRVKIDVSSLQKESKNIQEKINANIKDIENRFAKVDQHPSNWIGL